MVKLHPKFYNPTIFITIYAFILSSILIFRINQLNGYTPHWDESHHLSMGYRYYNAIKHNNWEKVHELFFNSGQMYPPFYHILIAITYAIFGVSAQSGLYANIPFALLLIFATYKLGSLINQSVGIISAFLIPIIPSFLRLSENVMMDLASISLFITSFYLVFRTKHFSNRKYSIFFGISVLLNMLTKWSFLIPISPIAYYLVDSLLKRHSLQKKAVVNLIIILLICLPGITWNLSNREYIIKTLQFSGNKNNFPQQMWKMPSGFTLNNLAFYAYNSPVSRTGIGLIPLIFFYISLVFAKKTQHIKYIYFSIIITYTTLTIINDKADKYMAYAYPLIIIAIVNFIFLIHKRWLKIGLCLILSLAISVNVLLSITIYPHLNKGISFRLSKANFLIFPMYLSNFPASNWPIEQIISDTQTSADFPTTIVVLPDHPRINPPNVSYYTSIMNKNTKIIAAYDLFNPTIDTSDGFEILTNYDYIIAKSGDQGYFANKNTNSNIINYLKENQKISLIGTYDTPLKDNIMLYKSLR